jgi:hypothetical protein
VAGASSLTGCDIEATTTPPRMSLTEEEVDEILPTTSSQQKAKWKQRKIKKGSRCKIQLNLLYHIAKLSQHDIVPTSQANTYNVCGTIINGNSSKGWDVQFGIFHLEDNIVRYTNHNKITVMDDSEDQPDCAGTSITTRLW